MIFAGIDAGSRTIKVVLIDADGVGRERLRVVASGVVDQGVHQNEIAHRLLDDLLAQEELSRGDLQGIVATGYGRKLLKDATSAVTEITCQAAGIAYRCPGARTVVDIGGQDSKLLRLGPDGGVHDFVMNDRCAAGTGRFLEVVATQLGVLLDQLGEMAAKSTRKIRISNMCVVFAETEIVGLLAMGTPPEDIAAGVQTSIAARVLAMGGGPIASPLIFTGGVALVPGMADAMASVRGEPVTAAEQPQSTCALGAAIIAAKKFFS